MSSHKTELKMSDKITFISAIVAKSYFSDTNSVPFFMSSFAVASVENGFDVIILQFNVFRNSMEKVKM